MTSAGRAAPSHGNAYEIFILVLTLMSLVVMVMLLLPLSDATLDTLRFYDNLICFVFLGDFALNLSQSRPRRDYFIRRRGWLDLLGSIPSLGILRLTGLLRLARISRLLRVARLLRGQHKKELISDIVHNRSQYALFITLLLVVLVLTTASVLVLEFESQSPDANIKTGGDALWWAFVTMTTVGYGDRYPVTGLGRTTAVAVMFLGVGVIGALASILASLLVAPAPPELADEAVAEPSPSPSAGSALSTGDAARVEAELANTRAELGLTRTELDLTRSEMASLRRLIAGGAVLAANPSELDP